jgi:PEGA domain-containing protein
MRSVRGWAAVSVAVVGIVGPACASAAPPRRVVVVRAPRLHVAVVGPVEVRRGHGKLHVEVEPERAKVYIDGRYQGHGDTNEVLRAGSHQVRVVLNDGREALRTVHVDAGRWTRVRLEI